MTNTERIIDTNINQDHQQPDYYDYNNKGHGAGRVLSVEDGARIRDAYIDNIGPMTLAAANMIEHFFAEGIEPDEIIMAIDDTGLAPRPSALYLRAIMSNWISNGVTISRAHGFSQPNRWWESSKPRRRD